MINFKYLQKTFIRSGFNQYHSIIFCIKSISNYFNKECSFNYLFKNLPLEEEGISFKGIANIIQSLQLQCEGLKVISLTDLEEINKIAIILINDVQGNNDFAVYYGKHERKYTVGIPSWGINLYTDIEMNAIWTERVILVIY
jgi:ABC-type bacteriocin/lantibiotic exporter with double-glycine peptidase domain